MKIRQSHAALLGVAMAAVPLAAALQEWRSIRAFEKAQDAAQAPEAGTEIQGGSEVAEGAPELVVVPEPLLVVCDWCGGDLTRPPILEDCPRVHGGA